MFSWICPTCGREVPPSKTDCPYCAELAGAQPAKPDGIETGGPVAAVPQPVYMTASTAPAVTPQYVQHPAAVHQPPAAWPPPAPRSGVPTWLMGIGFAVLFIGIAAAVYYGVSGRPTSAEKAGLENPGNASRQKVSNPLQKYVEVVGLRLISQDKKPTARFLVVNHSNTEIADLAANVTLWASTSRSEEDSVGSFTFRIPSLGPNESKELTEPLKTKLKMYELPDWQNATAEIQITSP